MADRSFLDWPFFDAPHRALAADLDAWAAVNARADHAAVDVACRAYVKALGADGWLRHAAPDPANADARHDVRALCLIRETLARHDGLADFAFVSCWPRCWPGARNTRSLQV